jgi:hypothetical protein
MEHPRRFQVEPPRRVLVVGNRGAGRAKLGKQLAERFNLPFIQIEHEQQAFGSQEPGAWRARVSELAAGDSWVMSGTDSGTFDLRVPRADWFIWVDLPISSCAMTVIRSTLRGRAQAKAGTGSALPRWPKLTDILHFPTDVAPRIMGTIDRERRNRTIFILRSRGDVLNFLARLPQAGGFGDHINRDKKPPV